MTTTKFKLGWKRRPRQSWMTVQTKRYPRPLGVSSSTIVIGGLYNYTKTDTHSGVPFLKDIPLIGWLFRTPYAPEVSKSEMMIFLTPRIINQKEAGLIDSV